MDLLERSLRGNLTPGEPGWSRNCMLWLRQPHTWRQPESGSETVSTSPLACTSLFDVYEQRVKSIYYLLVLSAQGVRDGRRQCWGDCVLKDWRVPGVGNNGTLLPRRSTTGD
ncbi:hypothetical protein RRG08_032503 [Elysia crispata]|uniref:Uncharacterized protein n=1 Tax=Elysia crispata TaxID=231223 RepID=A0AAE0ZXB4_9GAST|nr:hypothetical protein RRG08_032503 [Elysia crispata]